MREDLTENEYNEHTFKKLADGAITTLGINLSVWMFGSCSIIREYGREYGMLDFFNNEMEDHALILEFVMEDEQWKVEGIEITQD